MPDLGAESPPPLEEKAYELLFSHGESSDAVVARLKEAGASQMLAEVAVEVAFDLRHEKALRGELAWDSWLAALARNPWGAGTAVKILTVLTVPVTFLAIRWSTEWFPAGIYPWIVLALPGLVLGLLFFGLGSLPIYGWKHSQLGSPRGGAARPPAEPR